VQLFDVLADPLEQHDLNKGGHPQASLLESALNQWLEDVGQRVRFEQALAESAAKEDELRALGYIE
jgi:hypothetical protein